MDLNLPLKLESKGVKIYAFGEIGKLIG
jgi:hypothetical protein